MKILKEEAVNGSLHSLTFRNEGQPLDQFKAAVKDWIEENFHGWDEKEIYEKMSYLDFNKVVLHIEQGD